MVLTARRVIGTVLWVVTGLLLLFFVFSGWWLFAPFLFALGGGEQVLTLLLAIGLLGIAARIVSPRNPS